MQTRVSCRDHMILAQERSLTWPFNQLIEQPIDCYKLCFKNLPSLCWQRCPPISEVEGIVEAHLRTFGERRRWNTDVLLRLLAQLLTEVQVAAIKSCPFLSESTDTDVSASIFTDDIITLYIRYTVPLNLLGNY